MTYEFFAATSIRAAIDRIIPADAWPAGWDGGVGAYIAESPDLDWAFDDLRALAVRLESAAASKGSAFADLGEADQDFILALIAGESEGARELASLRRICMEGYYALRPDAEPAGLRMLGFRAVPEGVTPVEPDLAPDVGAAGVRPSYDAIVIGSGAGGGVAAQVLAQAGRSVLIIERAARTSNVDLRNDHLRGKRNAVYRPTAGPGAGHPRTVHIAGADLDLDGDANGFLYGLNADLMGGGTRLWQALAWRFLPEDFRMATVYGNPDGASLADWPVDYDEMEPYYTEAERELGVSGKEGPLTERTPRSAGYPLPPFETDAGRELLGAAADRLGWGWDAVPLALNSEAHDGRPACVRCAQCVGHACPVNAKNGSYNTFISRAVATGNTDVLYDAEAIHVEDGAGRATVTVMASTATTPVQLTVSADVVVVSAGAIETPRLLLASGIGNEHMGRHLHDHRFTSVLGAVAGMTKVFAGPGHSIATLDHVHSSGIPWGGAALIDLMGLLPLTFAQMMPAGVPAWGKGHKEWMSGARGNLFGVIGMGQEIPVPTSRVSLASVTDRWGRPGAALRKDVHPASLEIDAGMVARSEEWLTAAGATGLFQQRFGAPVAATEHSCGTARMGTSAEFSATDPYGRPYGTRRIVVCDSSLHPTNGSMNPTLTIMANAFRVAHHLAENWPS